MTKKRSLRREEGVRLHPIRAVANIANNMNLNILKRTLARLEIQLLAAPQQKMFGGSNWRAHVPREPGVYVLWDIKTRKVVYVGESGNLWDRFADLSRCVNHTCR